MRHAKKRYQLGRFTSWHDATIKSLARNMVIAQRMKTTLTRAKSSRSTIEHLITLAKTNTLFARRQAQKILGEHALVNALFNEIGPLFAKRTSGFTRIINLGKRRGDDAQMVIFELTEIKKKEVKKSKAVKEVKAEVVHDVKKPEGEEVLEEKKPEAKVALKDLAAKKQKPQKKFIGGIRSIFRKKSDSL